VFVGGERCQTVIAHGGVERSGEVGGEQAGEQRRRHVRLLQHDGVAVGGAGAQDLVHLVVAFEAEAASHVGARSARAGAQYPGAGLDVDSAHLLGEARQARVVELEPGSRHKASAEAAAPPVDQAFGLDGAERLAQRHAADAECVGDLDFGGQLVAGLQRVRDDQVFQPRRDAHVSG
jgi:hypothetical protein